MDTQNIEIKEENNVDTIDIEFQNKTKHEKNSALETENSQMDSQKIEIKKETNIAPIEDLASQNKNTENPKKIKKKGKYFETKDNIDDFEKSFNVEIVILSREQQFKDVLERKNSTNYLQSPYKCENCYKGYMSEDILKKHMLSQHDKSRGDIVCEFCKFRYKDRRGLNHHLKTHRLKFVCKQCSYVSRTTFNAKEHFKMHRGQLHQCDHCGKSHEKLSSHLSHIRLHHPSSLVWCHICAQACVGEFGLNAHMKKAHRDFPLPISCATCGTHFVSHTALTRHSRAALCSEHACVHCGEGYDDAVALREHLLVHQSQRVFKCEKCDKIFKRENLYSAHYKRIHVDNQDKSMKKKEKPWICEVCGKTLPNKSLLLYHQRNHTGEKPYRCTQCTKSFTMRKLLQSHLRVHTNDRPYVCKLCPKTFKGLSALRGHEYIHTGQTKMSSKNRLIK
nr:zinc finger protein 501 [Helicoverpa armigera]